jgi:hypothetical protein
MGAVIAACGARRGMQEPDPASGAMRFDLMHRQAPASGRATVDLPHAGYPAST